MGWFDQQLAIDSLSSFFQINGAKAQDFGRRVYQTFEAITFAQTISRTHTF